MNRAEPLPIRLLAWLHAFLLALFLLSLLLAAGRAEAQPVCGGDNLIAELERTDPALLARIREEAARTLNGDSLLWKLEKAGQETSWLFGTMHVTDPRVAELTPAAQRAYDAAGTVVIETTDVLDEGAMMAALLAEPELTMFTDGTTLASLLSPEDAALVDRRLEERGIPPASIARMKPWMLSAALALPACELARKAGGAEILDVKLASEAQRSGRQVAGLETAVEQLQALAALPLDFHMRSLVETLRLGDRMEDVVETMVVIYEDGQTGLFWPLFRAILPASADGEGYADFEEAMITTRNRNMARNARPMLERGSAFVAVGALHLPGPDGLVELFREAGYTVTPVR